MSIKSQTASRRSGAVIRRPGVVTRRSGGVTALRAWLVAVWTVAITFPGLPAAAQPVAAGIAPLAVDEAVADPGSESLTIAGANFGARPFVTLDLIPLDVRLAIDTRVVAVAPVGAMPPGTYQLTVSRGPGPTESASIDVVINGGAQPATALPAVVVPAQAGPDAAATVGDRTITIADVDAEWQKTDPAGYLAVMRQIGATRRRIANQMVADALLAREAASRGTTIDALLKEELPKRSIAMPDASVTSLYVSMGDRTRGASIEQMRPALRAWLARHTEPELARMTYVEELMKTSTRAEIVLTSLRADVDITSSDPVLGPPSAAVTIVAFGDLQSNEYVRLAQAFGRVRDTFGDRLRIVFKHLPTFGGPSDGVAQAAACAHAQGKFWAYHDAAAKPGTLDGTRQTRLAADVGVEPRAFEACLNSPETSRAAEAGDARSGPLRRDRQSRAAGQRPSGSRAARLPAALRLHEAPHRGGAGAPGARRGVAALTCRPLASSTVTT